MDECEGAAKSVEWARGVGVEMRGVQEVRIRAEGVVCEGEIEWLPKRPEGEMMAFQGDAPAEVAGVEDRWDAHARRSYAAPDMAGVVLVGNGLR